MSNKKTSQLLGTTLLRVALGIILLAHGLLKVLVFGIAGSVGFFESLGLPAIAAYFTILGEFAGGLGLIAGVYSRLAAALSVPLLVGASWAHLDNGWVLGNQGGGFEYPLLLVVITIIVAIQGPGSYAIDQLLFNKRWK